MPRFNVLQAQVQLSNQIPNLIAARNAYRISILQLAKTLGLDFNPARGIAAPLHVVGALNYIPRKIALQEAIELGKRNRPFLKQARANVLNQIEQVHVAIGNWLPNSCLAHCNILFLFIHKPKSTKMINLEFPFAIRRIE